MRDRHPFARSISLLAALALAALLAAPAGVSAQTFGVERQVYEVPPSMVGRHNGECKRITRQIAHYAEVVDMARERGDDAWEDGTLDHIGRLAERRARLCPTLYAQKPIGRELAMMLKSAAKIALKLFTMGMI